MTHKVGDIIQTKYGTAKVEEVRDGELLVRIPPKGAGKLIFIGMNEVIDGKNISK